MPLNVRLFLFIFSTLFASNPGNVSTSNYLFSPSTTDVLPANDVIILNSFPKAGQYTDAGGKQFDYGITRTTLINGSKSPLELSIKFPADSFAFVTGQNWYVKLFLLPDTISFENTPFDKSSWYFNDGLKPFLDAAYNTPTSLHETIRVNEDRVFYIAALYHNSRGVPKAELVLEGQNLLFRSARLDSLLIPCGKIVFQK